MNLQLRFAHARNPADVELYARVVRECTAASKGTYTGTTDPAKIRHIIATTFVRIIVVDQQDVGTVSHENDPLNTAHITELAILPGSAGHKIGWHAFKLYMGMLYKMNLHSFRLETHPKGPGKGLYSEFGFEVTNTVPNFQNTGQPRDVMQLHFQRTLPDVPVVRASV